MLFKNSTLACFAILAQCAFASDANSAWVVHEVAHLPTGWSRVSDAGADEPLNLRVALRHSHQDYLQVASAVSDPNSSRYGQHLSAKELRSLLPDMNKPALLIEEWLLANEATGVLRSQEWIAFTVTVSQARDLLNATFARYSYQSNPSILRTESYSIPPRLSDSIDFIFPTIQFMDIWFTSSLPGKKHRRQHTPKPVDCVYDTCPQALVDRYNIDYFPKNSSSGSGIGVLGFLEEYPVTEDITRFLKTYSPNNRTSSLDFKVDTANGGKNPNSLASAGVEAQLDVEYTTVFTGPLPVTFYSVGGRPPTLNGNGVGTANSSMNEPYLDFLTYILGQDSPPQVLSISYSDDEQTVPIRYAERVCDMFAQLAIRGVSVIVASGDGGAAGTGKGDCYGPDGKWRFLPTFPSSCPWVTSIGAIAAYGGGASYSSGGFSNYFPRPKYQDAVVPLAIQRLNGSHDGFYNTSGRGIPDVSLLGDNFLTVIGNSLSSHDGTSCSTPVFASMVALLNDLRLRAGKPVLGFLNPLLYQEGVRSVFTDITSGSSTGCANSTSSESGWDATEGWDPVTGLGAPDFMRLRKLFV